LKSKGRSRIYQRVGLLIAVVVVWGFHPRESVFANVISKGETRPAGYSQPVLIVNKSETKPSCPNRNAVLPSRLSQHQGKTHVFIEFDRPSGVLSRPESEAVNNGSFGVIWRESGKDDVDALAKVSFTTKREINIRYPRRSATSIRYSDLNMAMGEDVGTFTRSQHFNATEQQLWSEGNNHRASGLDSLPANYSQSEDQRPRRDALGPCYEFVPPLRLILAVLFLSCAVAINGYGRGWIRLLCLLPLAGTGWLVLGGHKYWCGGDNREYEHDPQLHSGKIVTQKLLTPPYYCNTVSRMANVFAKDKQIAAIGALAEGSSIRSIERNVQEFRNNA